MPRPSMKKNLPTQVNFSDSYDILMNAPIGVLTSTPDGRYIAVNHATAEMLGYDSPEELIKSVKDIAAQIYADPSDRDRFKRVMEEHGEVVNDEYRFRRRDGQEFLASISARALRDNSGKIIAYQGFYQDITERKQAEQTLRESEEKYRVLFENTSEAMFVTQDGRIVFFNPRTVVLSGYSENELLSRPFTEFVHQEDREMVMHRHIRRLRGEELPVRYTTRVLHSDGRILWVEVNSVVIQWNGKPATLNFLSDITERKQAEEALHRSENLFRKIFEILPIGLWIANKNGKLIQGNPAGVAIWGAQPNVGQREYEVFKARRLPSGEQIAPDDWALAHTVNKGETIVDELLEIDAFDGKKKIILNYTAPILDSSGQVEGAIVVNQDITERKRAEEALLHQKAHFESLFTNTKDAMVFFDTEQRIINVNAVFTTMFGYILEEILYKNINAVVDPLKQVHEYGSPRILRGEQIEMDALRYTKSGEPINVLLKGGPVRKQNEIVGGYAIYADITERKRAEEEREKLQSQLLQAQKMESIGIMAGGIAHDFNNLLHAMGGNLELLDMKIPDDHPGKKRIDIIQRSMDRATQLVKKLLLFTRKANIQTQVLDLNQEIHDASRLLERSIPRMISIDLILEENARPINADPIQVEQVLLNLGTNAADAMPDGGRMIIETANITLDQDFFRTHTGAKPGKFVLMTVSDTGCGMDKETRDQIFDPFFTTKEVGKGTGLGLASAYGIVKAHEGYITCYSEPGQGTAFRIYWPAAEQGEIEPDEIQTKQAVLQDGTETILVVDDDDEIRDLTREILEDSGYQVLDAASGEQALEIFKEHAKEINLVIMDLNMPGMGGRKCTTEMLSIDPSVKVLVASGYSADCHGKEALEFGAKDFISKPYQMREILAKIREVLDGE